MLSSSLGISLLKLPLSSSSLSVCWCKKHFIILDNCCHLTIPNFLKYYYWKLLKLIILLNLITERAKNLRKRYAQESHRFYLLRLSSFKGPLPGLRQFLATETPLKIINYIFCFTLKVILFLRYLNFWADFFGHVGK